MKCDHGRRVVAPLKLEFPKNATDENPAIIFVRAVDFVKAVKGETDIPWPDVDEHCREILIPVTVPKFTAALGDGILDRLYALYSQISDPDIKALNTENWCKFHMSASWLADRFAMFGRMDESNHIRQRVPREDGGFVCDMLTGPKPVLELDKIS